MRKVVLDEAYSFWPINPVHRFFSTLLLRFALAVLGVHHRLFFGLRVRGGERVKNLKGGFVTVCNHICMLDCAMVACLLSPHRSWYPTLKENLEMPFVRHLIRMLGGLPIPETPKSLHALWEKLEERLDAGEVVHFFPEGELIPYAEGIRPFERGAFALACAHGVPVVPLVLTPRKNTGLQKLFRRRPSLTLSVLEPVWPTGDSRTDAVQLMHRCRAQMQKQVGGNPQEAYYTPGRTTRTAIKNNVK